MGKTYRRGGGDEEYALERMRRENEKRAKKKSKRSFDSVEDDRDDLRGVVDKKWR